MFPFFILFCEYWYVGIGTAEDYVVWEGWKGIGTKGEIYLQLPDEISPLRISLETGVVKILKGGENMLMHSFQLKFALIKKKENLRYCIGMSMDLFRFKYYYQYTGFLPTCGFFAEIALYTIHRENNLEILYLSYSNEYVLVGYQKFELGLKWYFPMTR